MIVILKAQTLCVSHHRLLRLCVSVVEFLLRGCSLLMHVKDFWIILGYSAQRNARTHTFKYSHTHFHAHSCTESLFLSLTHV